jgi:hypothetical protein
VRAFAAYKDFLTVWQDADPEIPILKASESGVLTAGIARSLRPQYRRLSGQFGRRTEERDSFGFDAINEVVERSLRSAFFNIAVGDFVDGQDFPISDWESGLPSSAENSISA